MKAQRARKKETEKRKDCKNERHQERNVDGNKKSFINFISSGTKCVQSNKYDEI